MKAATLIYCLLCVGMSAISFFSNNDTRAIYFLLLCWVGLWINEKIKGDKNEN